MRNARELPADVFALSGTSTKARVGASVAIKQHRAGARIPGSRGDAATLAESAAASAVRGRRVGRGRCLRPLARAESERSKHQVGAAEQLHSS